MNDDALIESAQDGLFALARDRKLDEVEALWMQTLEAEQPDYEPLFHVAGYLSRRKLENRAALLLGLLIESVGERSGLPAAYAAARRAAVLAPSDRALRTELLALCSKAHADVPWLDALIDHVKLAETNDVDGALALLDAFLRFRPGVYAVHQRSQRAGRVKTFERGVFVLDSEDHEYRVPLADVLGMWEPIPPDDFRGLAAFEAPRLRQLAEADPEQLVTLFLRSVGGETELKLMRAALVPRIVSTEAWPSWWTRTRNLLKKSAWINVSTGAQPRIALRTEAAGYDEQVLARFAAARTPDARLDIALECIANRTRGEPHDASVAARIAEGLRAGANDAAPALGLALLAAAATLSEPQQPNPDADAFAAKLAALPNGTALLQGVESDEAARLLLEWTQRTAPDRWPSLYAEAFPSASLRLCEIIARELTRGGHEALFVTACESALAVPERSALALGWTWRYLLGTGGPLAGKLDPVGVTSALLHHMHRVERMPRHADGRADARQNLSRLRTLLGAGDARLLVQLIERSAPEEARRLYEAVSAGEGLTVDIFRAAHDAFREHHPDLFAESKPLWEDGYIYMTAAGLAKCQAAMDKVVHEDMPRIAQTIGAAAEKGDLRENWEYKSALEERDRLVERAGRLRETLDHARVIDPAAITGECVTVGASVRLRDASGAERRVTFLGPYDTDIEHGIYFYQAPLSLRFMGRKVGDRVRAAFGDTEREYEIIAIEKGV